VNRLIARVLNNIEMEILNKINANIYKCKIQLEINLRDARPKKIKHLSSNDYPQNVNVNISTMFNTT